MVDVSLKPLQPKDALAYFRQKGLRKGFDYRDVWQAEHAKAFTVAKMMSRELLETTRAAVDKAITDGQTFEQFKKGLKPILQAAGWWGKQEMRDPLTGETKLVQLGSDRRLRTIFSTNARVAYQVGNWQRAWAVRDLMPFLIYRHSDGERFPRPIHVAWNFVCRPIDDPWWDKHYPPCEWGCKCYTESASERMLADRGLTVTQKPPNFGKAEWVNPRTGEVEEVEKGISPAWNYNVGKAPLNGLSPKPAPAPDGRPTPDLTAPVAEGLGKPPRPGRTPRATPAPATAGPEAETPAPTASSPAAASKDDVDGFLKVFDAQDETKIVNDRSSWPLVIGNDMFTDVDGQLVTPRPDLPGTLPEAAQALKSYDRAEWLWQSSAAPEELAAAKLDQVAQAAAVPGDAQKATRWAKVPQWQVDLAKEHGIDMGDFDQASDPSSLRHILNRHGDEAIEAPKGQVAVNPGDFRDIPYVVARPDYMIFAKSAGKGLSIVGYVTDRFGARVVYLTVIRTGKFALATKTMWKTPGTSDVERLLSSLTHNVRNDTGAMPIIVKTTGKGNPPAAVLSPALIRRYTKTLDSRRITLDFSSAAWTYDIVPLKSDESGS